VHKGTAPAARRA